MSRHDADDLHHLPGEDSLPTGPGLLGDGEDPDSKLDQGGIVLTVLDWVGGGLHGEPGGSKQVPAGGEHHLPKGECTDIQYESVLYILHTTAFHMEMEDDC